MYYIIIYTHYIPRTLSQAFLPQLKIILFGRAGVGSTRVVPHDETQCKFMQQMNPISSKQSGLEIFSNLDLNHN